MLQEMASDEIEKMAALKVGASSSEDVEFVSFKDLAFPSGRLMPMGSNGNLEGILGANMLAVGSGIDSYSELQPGIDYHVDAVMDGAPPRKEGWLQKEGHGSLAEGLGKSSFLGNVLGSKWTRRYLVLSNGFLEYFELPEYSPAPWGTHREGQRASLQCSSGTLPPPFSSASASSTGTATAAAVDVSDGGLMASRRSGADLPAVVVSGEATDAVTASASALGLASLPGASSSSLSPCPASQLKGIHVTNAKGHICLAGARLSEPKSVRKGTHGERMPAFRIDCSPTDCGEYNHGYRGRVLLRASVNQTALAHQTTSALSSASLVPHRRLSSSDKWKQPSTKAPDRPTPEQQEEQHKSSSGNGDGGGAARSSGTSGLRRRLSSSAGAMVGATLGTACTVPGAHLKYVLSGDDDADSAQWREAIQAHIAFASTDLGTAARRAVLAAREVTREARMSAVQSSAAGHGTPAPTTAVPSEEPEAPPERWRCNAPIVGPGNPAVLCQDCGGGAKAHRCSVCDKQEHGFIHAATICDVCHAGHGSKCSRCDADVDGLRAYATLCTGCGGGFRSGNCCKMRQS
jgi:hypothetical protein